MQTLATHHFFGQSSRAWIVVCLNPLKLSNFSYTFADGCKTHCLLRTEMTVCHGRGLAAYSHSSVSCSLVRVCEGERAVAERCCAGSLGPKTLRLCLTKPMPLQAQTTWQRHIPATLFRLQSRLVNVLGFNFNNHFLPVQYRLDSTDVTWSTGWRWCPKLDTPIVTPSEARPIRSCHKGRAEENCTFFQSWIYRDFLQTASYIHSTMCHSFLLSSFFPQYTNLLVYRLSP